MQLRYSDPAKRDLAEIWALFFEVSQDVADRLIRKILRKIQLLARFPELGAIDVRFRGRNLRSTNSKPFVVYYHIESDCVEIVRVIHGARDHGPLLGGTQRS